MTLQLTDNEYWTLIKALQCALAYTRHTPAHIRDPYRQLLDRFIHEYSANSQPTTPATATQGRKETN
jgi:hypothetical protein